MRDALARWGAAPEWHATVDDAMEVLGTVVRTELGADWTLALQGSVRQGLALRGSDVDVVIHRNRAEPPLPTLRAVASSWADLAETYPDQYAVVRRLFRARVPVVRLAYDDVEIDVSAGDPTRGMCDDKVRAILGTEGPALANLCRFAKVFATTRKLSITHKGGLSNFSWVLLALIFASTRDGKVALARGKQRALWLALLRFVRGLEDHASLSLDGAARPTRGRLYLAVPGQPDQNAARCLTDKFWRGRIAPALDSAIKELEGGVALRKFLGSVKSARVRDTEPETPELPELPEPPVPESTEATAVMTKPRELDSLLRLREVLRGGAGPAVKRAAEGPEHRKRAAA